MSPFVLQLVLLFFLLSCSFFFSASETALFSISRVDLHRLRDEKHPAAAVLTRLLGQPRALLVTLLVGNELVNIAAAAVTAATVARIIDTDDLWVTTVVSTAVFVPVLLLFGEITPKSLAIRRPVAWALFVARPIRWFAMLVTPLRVLVKSVADAAISLLGGAPRRDPVFNEETYRSLVDLGQEEGVLDESERELIHNVFEFGDTTVAEVMTPASEIFAIPYGLPVAEMIQRVRENGYSRVPVYRGRPDNVVGILHAKVLIPFARDQSLKPTPVSELLRRAEFVPDRTKAAELFRTFRKKRFRIAIVVNEFGAVTGLVTAEDLLEELFGEIEDERDRAEKVRGTARARKEQPRQ